jgi:hypothetical protein
MENVIVIISMIAVIALLSTILQCRTRRGDRGEDRRED